jgi:predicted Zn-ribbon and HTH transcriptional regulator
MPRERLEVADIFRAYGSAWRRARAGHLSLGQLKVMSAIERCRTAALGGHVAACQNCGHRHVAYNSCRNRHCPKCQGAAARDWLAARQAELLPVAYYHVVFTLPAPISDIAYDNKAVVYGLLFKAAAETLLTIAADPRHLGARIGLTAVLHTWGSALTHHPHIHCIVPGGGLSPACPGQRSGGQRWISCRPGFFLPVRVLSRLFRRLFLEKLAAAHEAGRLQFFGALASLRESSAFAAWLAPLRKIEWVVYAKRPFAGPEAVLAYLSRYTHRVAISNRRLVALDDGGVTFKWKDYRAPKSNGARTRYKRMTLAADEFIRRFLLHVLPAGFHRIRHYGLFANGGRAENLAQARQLLGQPPAHAQIEPLTETDQPTPLAQPCPCCGGPMIVIETFEPEHAPKHHAPRAPPAGKAASRPPSPLRAA